MAGINNNSNPFLGQVRLGPQIIQLIPGPPGLPGTSAVTVDTTANFTQPAVGANVSVALTSTTPLGAGLGVFIVGGGYYSVVSITDGFDAVLKNLGTTGNAAPTTTVPLGSLVVPTGPPSSGLTIEANGAAITQRAILDLNDLTYIDDAGGGRMRFFASAGAPMTGSSFTLSNTQPWGEIVGGGSYTLPASPVTGLEFVLTDVSGTTSANPASLSGNGPNVTDPQTYNAGATASLRNNFKTFRFRYNGSLYRCTGVS